MKSYYKEKVHNLIDEIQDEKILEMLFFFMRRAVEKSKEIQISQIEKKTLIQLRGKKTKEEVAKACNITVVALTAYENGERVPRDEVKRKICEYYGLTNYCKQIKNAAPTDQSKSCTK